MLTSPGGASAVREIDRTDRPAYRPFRVTVTSTTRMCPSFLRVTLAGEDLDLFGRAGLDQRVKIVFPLPDGTLCDIDTPDVVESGTWYERWRALPDGRRNPVRTYTVRRVRPERRELDIDLVVHGGTGPAARWLEAVRPGDEVIVVGPDARSIHSNVGIDFHPGPARRLLLAGDETAAPAISAILESLPADRAAQAFIEVPDAEDRFALDLPPTAEVAWLPREGAPVGSRLVPAVTGWARSEERLLRAAAAPAPQPYQEVDVDAEILWEAPAEPPDEAFYAWLAGEAGVIKDLRRLLVRGHGVDRSRVAFMGYWRQGRAELS
jgi:NADPH-dependent ferric siderophore reductase